VKNLANFHLQKFIWNFKNPIQNSGQILENWKVRNIFFYIFKYPLWILSIMEAQNHKRVFRFEIWLDLSTILSSKFFGKSYYTMSKWGLKLYFENNSYDLTRSGQALIFKLFPTLWRFMIAIDFIVKWTSLPFIITKCRWSMSFTVP